MGYRRLESEQIRVAVNARQLFEQLEQHRLQADSVAGSMHWKTINGREYLYRAYSYGKNRSLGARCGETERIKAQFERRQSDYKAQEAAYRDQFKRHAAYIKANDLNRFPLAGARVLRALHQQKIPYRLIGTNALYAFEARAGVMIQSEHLATEDMDVLMDARQGIRILSGLEPGSLLSLLQKSDKSFHKVSSSPFEFAAANAKGYRVDFITQGSGSPMQRSAFDELLDKEDLHPVAIDTLKWHVSAPHYDAVVFDEQGMPLRVATVDPRAFVLHKWFVSRQPDREPMKRIRDENQARLVVTMIRNELTDLPLTRAISRIFPRTLQVQAVDEMDDFSL